MTQYIDKDALVAEIEKVYNEHYKFLPSDIAENIQDFKDDVLIIIDTLEVKEIGVDVGSPEGDLGRKTVQVIDANGYVKEIKIQKG